MKIEKLNATFGRLDHAELKLCDGLNILQAPNETGKSTWCAFLLAMLYGVSSRERDKANFIAEKNRYAPWSGAAMTGRLACSIDGQALTITRETKRANAPMSEFSAVYTGTGDPVPGLTGPTCGEVLLGVPREVYERSAFIRQTGLPLTQDAELERRIVSLITTGQEDTSYIEVAEALKKQLNRRRYTTRGEIPAALEKQQLLQRQLEELEILSAQLSDTRRQLDAFAQQKEAIQAQLAQHDQWEAHQRRTALETARQQMEQFERAADETAQRLTEERIPESETIARLRGAIVNLETVRKSAQKAMAEKHAAMKAAVAAETAVSANLFAGKTPEEVQKEAQTPPNIPLGAGPTLAIYLIGLLAACGAGLLIAWRSAALTAVWQAAACAVGGGLILVSTILVERIVRKKRLSQAQYAAQIKRFGTADPDEIAALAQQYADLCRARDEAQAAMAQKTATYDALYASRTANEQGILLEVRRFAPAAFDIPAADAALRSCAVRRKALLDAQAAARDARIRYDAQRQLTQEPESEPSASSCTPPTREKSALQDDWNQLCAAASAAQTQADQLSGRIAAIGDPAALRAGEEALQQEIEKLTGEYDAIALAMETLSAANTTLQNRFSPELGRKTARIFAQLTDNRYTGVVLDRTLHLCAEPAGDAVYRDAQLLSAGAADQLYLSARLAICDLVLPAEKAVPIVLDDALAAFDDHRCAAALRWLKAESAKRQILVFTCHRREAEFFSGDKEVNIQELTRPCNSV